MTAAGPIGSCVYARQHAWPGLAGRLQQYRTDLAAGSLLAAIWLMMVVVADPRGEFPLNDDWVYALAVRAVLDTGHFQLPATATANVFAQVYWGALFCLPFGFSFTALRISTIVLGLVGIVALYTCLRQVGGRPRIALLGSLALAANPIYFGLSLSFMTDVPFVAVTLVSLSLLIRGLQTRSAAFLLGGIILAFVAILIRQLALVFLLGLCVALPFRYGFKFRTCVAAALPLVVGLFLHRAYQHWLIDTGRTPHLVAAAVRIPDLSTSLDFLVASVGTIATTLPYLGIFLLPVLVAFPGLWKSANPALKGWTFHPGLIGCCTIFMAVLIRYGAWMPLRGNTLLASGFGPLTVADISLRHLNAPGVSLGVGLFWAAVTLAGCAGACCVGAFVAWHLRRCCAAMSNARLRQDVWLDVLLAISMMSYAVLLLLVDNLFDRYVLPLLPLLTLLLVARATPSGTAPTRSALVAGLLLVLSIGGLSVAAAHDYLAWNRSRWLALSDLMNAGISPRQIDGGYEFNGYFLNDPSYVPVPGKSYWWVDRDDYMVASGPLAGYRELRRYDFARWLPLQEHTVYVMQKDGEIR